MKAMSHQKVAVSVPAELLAAARKAVASGQAPSVSAYVAEAMEEKARRQSLEDVLDAMDRQFGRPSADAEAWAQRVLRH